MPERVASMLTGLVSVTFRKLSPPDIARLAKEAGLDGIEWGGDVHCPPGDTQAAENIAELMREHGLVTISYGSYYRAGSRAPFDPVVNTAVMLGTYNIRIWAGDMASVQAKDEEWSLIVEDSRRCADMAAAHGITISYEYHADTLTDTLPSAVRLLNEVDRSNVLTYWQPPSGASVEENILAIRRLIGMKKLKNLHVFSWENAQRMPLAHSEALWRQYIREASSCEPALLLEFVKDDDPARMIEDAQTLRRLRR